tara:strand:+ start:19518 stop:19739 length:222 start_codon:yes stop_codon:yes gene_type:complete
MNTLRDNFKEWFSTVLGALILTALAVNFFTEWPRPLDIYESATMLVVAGVFVFGNVKKFFQAAQDLLFKKIDR